MKKQSWVVKENKTGNDPDIPRFTIDYNQRDSAKNRNASHQILSLLKQDADMAIKFDSALFNESQKVREAIVFEFIEQLKSLGLEYRYRKYCGPPSNNLLGQLMRLRKKDEVYHEVIVDLPDQLWRQDSPFHLSLAHGTFYYIGRRTEKETGILDFLYSQPLLEDLVNHFHLIVFDWTYYGQMGLFTNSATLDELRERLTVDG